MLRSYLTIAFRNLFKRDTSSLISIAGLALAMSCCIFISLFVFDELQFDRFHEKGDRIYRLLIANSKTGENDALMSAVVFPLIMDEMPEFESGFRLSDMVNEPIKSGRKLFTGEVFFAENEIFHVLSFPLERGDPETALKEPFTAVITDSLARKYFGDGDPVGRTFTLYGKFEFRITGILKDIPQHSHIRPELIASLCSYNTISPEMMSDIRMSGVYFYFLLKPNASPVEAEAKLAKIFEKNYGNDPPGRGFVLQPLSRIYLHSAGTQWDIASHGNIVYVKSFAVIALLILFMASFNYANYLLVRVKVREKEISVRKLLGAGFRSIVSQFLAETVSYMLISLALALVLVELFMHQFNQLAGKEMDFSSVLRPEIIRSILLLLIVTTSASVAYPARIAATSDSFNRLKGNATGLRLFPSHFLIGFRQIVTCVQFVIAIALLVATGVIFHQLDFMRKTDLGFNKEHLVAITNPYGIDMYRRFETFRNEALSNPQVRSVSAGTNVPSKNLNYYTQMWVRNRKEKDGLHAAQVAVDYEYFATLQAKIVSGRDLSREHKTDETEGVIINSEAAKELGLMNPVGSELSGINNASDPQTVIGVVDDIHFMSFREKVEPTVFFLRQWSANTIVLRLSGNDIPATMAFLERTWGTLVPDHPFIYSFLDESFDRLYRSDQQTSTMILVFCVFAILLSSIGLYSIVSLLAQMRKKEIGVRKVLGASLTDVLFLTTSEYLVIVLVANIFAWPLAYYVMNRWLQDFAYRIDLTWTTFASAGGIALIVALLTVSVQSIRAGLANPVDSLRTE